MKTPLAWRNLVHNKVRTAVAVAGVAFAVVLIFMQLGFKGAVVATATTLYRALDFEVLIRSKDYLEFADARSFPLMRLPMAGTAPGVRSVAPAYVQLNEWRNPADGSRRAILVLAANARQPAFDNAEIRSQVPRLTAPEFVLIDRRSHWQFGPANGKKFSQLDLGRKTNVGEPMVEIVGTYALGAGLSADGSLVTSDRGFVRVSPGASLDHATFGLVKLDDPEADREAAAKIIKSRLPDDVEVLSREQVFAQETDYWLNGTPIGLIFRMGVWVSLIVGVAIVYQVLSSDVAAHLREYATLKAMGYGDNRLATVVISQAIILAGLGFAPGLVTALILYAVTGHFANLPLDMTWPRIGGVLLLTAAMCVASGLAALRKVYVADPAELF